MKGELTTLPDQLAAELVTLGPTLTTFEARRDAINCEGGVRARYNTRLFRLCRALNSSDALATRIGDEIGRQCDAFVAAALPPADSGLYVGLSRN